MKQQSWEKRFDVLLKENEKNVVQIANLKAELKLATETNERNFKLARDYGDTVIRLGKVLEVLTEKSLADGKTFKYDGSNWTLAK